MDIPLRGSEEALKERHRGPRVRQSITGNLLGQMLHDLRLHRGQYFEYLSLLW
jgi:hypothetical protein